jgi:hypothetical protein
MQTFLPYPCPKKSAKVLDDKRLGKQRVECVQIADCLLVKESSWKNHPAVKMWKGYEKFLVNDYLKAMLDEWQDRGFKNEKCLSHYYRLSQYSKGVGEDYKVPPWIDHDFCEAHKSNLLRKKPEYYKNHWNNVPDDLPYVWPV